MSTQARASLESMRRLAGATILQLAPGNENTARNALTVASLLRRPLTIIGRFLARLATTMPHRCFSE